MPCFTFHVPYNISLSVTVFIHYRKQIHYDIFSQQHLNFVRSPQAKFNYIPQIDQSLVCCLRRAIQLQLERRKHTAQIQACLLT